MRLSTQLHDLKQRADYITMRVHSPARHRVNQDYAGDDVAQIAGVDRELRVNSVCGEKLVDPTAEPWDDDRVGASAAAN
jgi:hypothetical protein